MGKLPVQEWSWARVGDSPWARGATVIGLAVLVLWVHGTWDLPAEDARPESESTPVQAATSLQGVRLGDTLAAATSSHGPFDREARRPGMVRKHADEEDYVQRNGQLRLGVRGGLIHSVAYACKEGRDRMVVNNVACHDAGDKVRKAFGERLRVLCAKVKADDPNRAMAPFVQAYDAVEQGTRHIVIKDVVAGFIVTDPAELESLVGFNWEPCR